MGEGIYGIRKHIARALFQRTKHLEGFSVNEFREANFQNLTRLKHSGSISDFFLDLKDYGYTVKLGEVKAHHEAAKGRKVTLWQWSRKAQLQFS